jgi:hypothetical protein
VSNIAIHCAAVTSSTASSPVTTSAFCTVGSDHMVNTAQSFTAWCVVVLSILVTTGTFVTDYWTKIHRCGAYTSLKLRILQHTYVGD